MGMDDRDGQSVVRGACDDPNRDLGPLIAEVREMAEYARQALDARDLAPDSRDELWRHAAAFRDLAAVLHDLVRGIHPDLGC